MQGTCKESRRKLAAWEWPRAGRCFSDTFPAGRKGNVFKGPKGGKFGTLYGQPPIGARITPPIKWEGMALGIQRALDRMERNVSSHRGQLGRSGLYCAIDHSERL